MSRAAGSSVRPRFSKSQLACLLRAVHHPHDQRTLRLRRFGKFDMQPVENNRTKRFVMNTQTQTHTNRTGGAAQANNLVVLLSGVRNEFSGPNDTDRPDRLTELHQIRYFPHFGPPTLSGQVRSTLIQYRYRYTLIN